jgi:hypothetical protein
MESRLKKFDAVKRPRLSERGRGNGIIRGEFSTGLKNDYNARGAEVLKIKGVI